MKKITYEQLKKIRDHHESCIIINVLPATEFVKAHIPDSVSVPLDTPHFTEQVQKTGCSKNDKIVVYCAGIQCPAARNAAEQLEEAGFSDVYAYEGGLKEWQEKTGARQVA